MSESKIPRDLHLQIAKEKHALLPAIMKELDIAQVAGQTFLNKRNRRTEGVGIQVL